MDRPNNALEVLTWLLDPSEEYRGTGRTTALISTYIALAIAYPGVPIAVRDHYAGAPTSHIRNMTDLVVKGVKKFRPSGEVSRVSDDILMFTVGEESNGICPSCGSASPLHARDCDLNIHQEP